VPGCRTTSTRCSSGCAIEPRLQDEHSHVSSEQRQRIGELVLRAERERERIEETARRLVEELDEATLRAIVADWLDGQESV
jgi:hypothetical protein